MAQFRYEGWSQALASIDRAVAESEERQYAAKHADFARVEESIQDSLLGAAFVICQTELLRTCSEIATLKPEPAHEYDVCNHASAFDVRQKYEIIGFRCEGSHTVEPSGGLPKFRDVGLDAMPSTVSIINSVANFWKHCDEWEEDDWAGKTSHAKHSVPRIALVGLGQQERRLNVAVAILAAGGVVELAERVGEWRVEVWVHATRGYAYGFMPE